MRFFRRIFDRSRVEAYCGPTTVYHIVAEILPWLLFLVTSIVLLALWSRIPDQIPMHADFHGNVNGWGGKGSLLAIGGVYFGMNLLLWIIGYFPQSWNNGVRINSTGLRRDNSVRGYRLTRDLLCDLRISMAILFSGTMLWTAFGDLSRFPVWINAGIWILLLVPLARYLIRMFLLK